MALTAQDVHDKQFKLVRAATGYDIDEVDTFLDEVEAEIRRLTDALAGSPAGSQPEQGSPADRAPSEPPPPGEPDAQQVAGILALAQRMADEYVAEARRSADTLVSDASERARAVLSDLESQQAVLEARVAALRTTQAEIRTRLTEYFESQLAELRTEFAAPADPPTGSDEA